MECMEEVEEESQLDDVRKAVITGTIKKLEANKRTGGFTLSFDIPESEASQFVKLIDPAFNQLLHIVVIPSGDIGE